MSHSPTLTSLYTPFLQKEEHVPSQSSHKEEPFVSPPPPCFSPRAVYSAEYNFPSPEPTSLTTTAPPPSQWNFIRVLWIVAVGLIIAFLLASLLEYLMTDYDDEDDCEEDEET